MRKITLLAAMLMCMASSIMAQDLDEKYATDLLPVGTQAPDLIDALDSIHSVADFHGRCVVLDFFATWCGDCRKDLPEMKELFRQYDREGVEFIGISFDTDSDVLQEFMDKEPIPWRVLSELKKMKESKMAKSYRIQWIPTMYLIDTEGRVLLATVEINKLKAKLAELKAANKLVEPGMKRKDHAPRFQGGKPKLVQFMNANLKYPAKARQYGVQGRVYMQFYVEKDGKLTDPSVMKADFTDRLATKAFSKYNQKQKQAMREEGENQLKAEALRVVKKMPAWEPAMRRGKPIRAKYTIPISFKLN